ncbi:hypothetical protein RFI_15926 [Reticulomyxa filosa]|uniref:Uncharacterized protein n=1 Tax=Reticulomyxa filosa TaxID=46433 RepID=X6N5S3_RETFI|nr:hypothetical protein RFI_15926 [Reticulomyxa filosa]|eukprot:ETO21278.1 hypothetical protein RFI_15926 [Reticulomyxa filosa]
MENEIELDTRSEGRRQQQSYYVLPRYFFLIFIYFFILSGGVLFSPFTEEGGGGKRRKVLLLFFYVFFLVDIFFFFCVSEPKAEVEFSNQLDKVAWSVKVGSNWKSAAMEADSSVAYKVVDNVTLGAKFSVEKEALKTAFGIKDYNFKFEWQRNSDQTLVIDTDKKLESIKLGGFATLRENYVGFAQVQWDKNNTKRLGWEAGIEKRINDSSSLTGISRQASAGSLLYKGKIDKFEGHLAYNFDLDKPPAERHSLEYKLCFNF